VIVTMIVGAAVIVAVLAAVFGSPVHGGPQ